MFEFLKRKGQSQIFGIPVDMIFVIIVASILILVLVPAITDSKSVGNTLFSSLARILFGG